jgi:hypothetical protein
MYIDNWQEREDFASIDAIIPIHDISRPIRRTVQLLLDERPELAARGARLHVLIVCHNISVDSVRAVLGAELVTEDVSLVEFRDGLYSPAGPKNHGLQKSRADYISFVDSDDYLERGALASWIDLAEARNADAVLAPLRLKDGSILASPRMRPSKPALLDPLRDRLATRSTPLGLLRRTRLDDIGFRYTEGIRTGEDLEPTLRLFFTGSRIVYPYGAPAYCPTDDAGSSRVTASVKPLSDELRWSSSLSGQSWLSSIPEAERSAIRTKLMRVHGIGALRRRGELIALTNANDDATKQQDGQFWNSEERSAWMDFCVRMEKLSEDMGAMSKREVRFIQAALVAQTEPELVSAYQRYISAKPWEVVLPSRTRLIFARDSLVRHYSNEVGRQAFERFTRMVRK